MTDLKDAKSFFRETHERWMERRSRKQENSDYQDEWYETQCLSCKYYLPLAGEFGVDYGVCSNPKSEFDAFVRFEHDGCFSHLAIEE